MCLFLVSAVSFYFNYIVLSPHMSGYCIVLQALSRRSNSYIVRSGMMFSSSREDNCFLQVAKDTNNT